MQGWPTETLAADNRVGLAGVVLIKLIEVGITRVRQMLHSVQRAMVSAWE